MKTFNSIFKETQLMTTSIINFSLFFVHSTWVSLAFAVLFPNAASAATPPKLQNSSSSVEVPDYLNPNPNPLQSNLDNVQTSSVALNQAREALNLARLRFQAGVGTQTEVINAENDLTTAEGNRVTAILNYNIALANLQRSVTYRASR